MNKALALFESTHLVIKAERLCNTNRLACRAVAVPRSISTDCGIGLEVTEDLMTRVDDLLAKNDITFSWHRLP